MSNNEIKLNSGSFQLSDFTLPGGKLLFSGPKVSYLPKDSKTVFSYEENEREEISKYYINSVDVSKSSFFEQIRSIKGLENTKFGESHISTCKSLLSRECSRFLTPEAVESVHEEKKI